MYIFIPIPRIGFIFLKRFKLRFEFPNLASVYFIIVGLNFESLNQILDFSFLKSP
jgi:hypothetical protein